MSPKEQNILDTLNLLVLLFRSRKTTLPRLSEEESQTLFVTKEHLEGAKISIPVFINTLETLATKGYLAYVPIHEQKMHDDITEFKDSPLYSEVMAKIRQGATELQNTNLKEGIATVFENTIPKNMSYDKEGLMADPFTIADLFEQGLNLITSQTEQSISVVLLMPFRSIDKLLKKMNQGIKFDDIQDTNIWYDHDKKILYVGSTMFVTSYRGTTSRTHFILSALFKNLNKESIIDYDAVEEFHNVHNGNKKHYDSMRTFVKNNTKLRDIFEIYTDRIGINPKYKDDVH